MRLIEKYIQVVRMDGLNTKKAVDFSGSPSVKLPGLTFDNSANNALTGLTVVSLAATAGVTLQVTSPGTNENLLLSPKGTSGQLRSSAATNRLGVGSNGGSGTYLVLGSLGDANNVFVNADGSGTDVGLRLRAKGTSRVQIQDNLAIPAGGSTAGSVSIGNSGPAIYVGSGAPTVSAPQGSLYLRTNGTTTNDRLYVNNSSGTGTTWTAITTAA